MAKAKSSKKTAKKTLNKSTKKKNVKASSSGEALSASALSKIPKLEKNVLSRRHSDGSVAVMCLDNDEYFFIINDIAAEAWLLIDGKKSWRQIQERLVAKHNPPAKRFMKDFSNLLKELKKEKLIRQ